MIGTSGAIPPIFPKEHLRQATQGDRTDQKSQTDCVPPVLTKRQNAKAVQESDNRHR
ncbi:MAG: hypothetical protein WA510_04585 [Acidobacteriaceae bacterium]